jgi:hypothetical protein
LKHHAAAAFNQVDHNHCGVSDVPVATVDLNPHLPNHAAASAVRAQTADMPHQKSRHLQP